MAAKGLFWIGEIDSGETCHRTENWGTFWIHLGRQDCVVRGLCPLVSISSLLVARLSHYWEPGRKTFVEIYGVQSIELSMLFVGLVLIVLRGVDFVMGGPTYRLVVASKCYIKSIVAELYAHHH